MRKNICTFCRIFEATSVIFFTGTLSSLFKSTSGTLLRLLTSSRTFWGIHFRRERRIINELEFFLWILLRTLFFRVRKELGKGLLSIQANMNERTLTELEEERVDRLNRKKRESLFIEQFYIFADESRTYFNFRFFFFFLFCSKKKKWKEMIAIQTQVASSSSKNEARTVSITSEQNRTIFERIQKKMYFLSFDGWYSSSSPGHLRDMTMSEWTSWTWTSKKRSKSERVSFASFLFNSFHLHNGHHRRKDQEPDEVTGRK